MAISFVAVGTEVTGSAGGSINVPFPAGLVNDTIILFWESDTSTDNPTSTTCPNNFKSTYGTHGYGYQWGNASGTGSGNASLGTLSAGFYDAFCIRYRGVDNVTPINIAAFDPNTHTTSSLVTTLANCMEFGAITDDGGYSAGQSPPSGWTLRLDGSGNNFMAAERLRVSAGGTGTSVFPGAGGSGIAHLCLAPAASASTVIGSVAYGQQRVLWPPRQSFSRPGITIGTPPATPPPVFVHTVTPEPQQLILPSYARTGLVVAAAAAPPPVAITAAGKPAVVPVPPSYMETAFDPSVIETVPVPNVEYGKITTQPVPPSYAETAFDPSAVETVPVLPPAYGKSTTQPVFPSYAEYAFDPSGVETVPVPTVEYGRIVPWPVQPSYAETAFDPSAVETVPVPFIGYGKGYAQPPLLFGTIILGLPDQQVETVPVPSMLYGQSKVQPVPVGYVVLGIQPPVVNTGGQLYPVLQGAAILPTVQPSKLYPGITIGTPPVQTFTAYTISSNSAKVQAVPASFSIQGIQPDVQARFLEGQSVLTPVQPSVLIRGLYHPDVETVPVIQALIGTPPQGGVKPSQLLTGAYPQPAVFSQFSTRLYARARDARTVYPSRILLGLQAGIAPEIARPGLVVVTFAGDTVQVAFVPMREVDVAFGADTVDVSFRATDRWVDVSFAAHTVEVDFRV